MFKGKWSHAHFLAQEQAVLDMSANGRHKEAVEATISLVQHARSAGEEAYSGADLDLATACFLLGRALQNVRDPAEALDAFGKGRQLFIEIAQKQRDDAAEGMAGHCLFEQGNCYLELKRPNEALLAYMAQLDQSEKRGAFRDVAVVTAQLGAWFLDQGRYPEAFMYYEAAREKFMRLNEPASTAVALQQLGLICQKTQRPQLAETAYRECLKIRSGLQDVAGQVSVLILLGGLYQGDPARRKHAIDIFSSAADMCQQIHDVDRAAEILRLIEQLQNLAGSPAGAA